MVASKTLYELLDALADTKITADATQLICSINKNRAFYRNCSHNFLGAHTPVTKANKPLHSQVSHR
jgi:hypothetical protein